MECQAACATRAEPTAAATHGATQAVARGRHDRCLRGDHGIEVVAAIRHMCDALDVPGGDATLADLTANVRYAVNCGFGPLFAPSGDGWATRDDLATVDCESARRYYNFAFVRVVKKRKRDERELMWVRNGVQCVLERVLCALDARVASLQFKAASRADDL